MKRITAAIVCRVTAFLLLAGCEPQTRSRELAICGTYAVPGLALGDLKGGTYSVGILEEDAYGRYLYEFAAENVVTGEWSTALVICQKIDTEYVYYYEDECFLLPGYGEYDIETLKAKNDWDEPLDESRLSRRKNQTSVDLYIIMDTPLDVQKIRTAFAAKKGIMESDIVNYCILDVDNAGHELFWFRVYENGQPEDYFAVVDPAYTVECLRVTGYAFDISELIALKQTAGWVYGY